MTPGDTHDTALAHALAHAPAFALIDIADTAQAMHAASACIAGGFRIVAIGAKIPNAGNLIGALAARPDTLIGMAHARTVEDIEDAAAGGACFATGIGWSDALATACTDAKLAYIPSALTPAEVVACVDAGAARVLIYPVASMGGPRHIRFLAAALPDVALWVHGGIPGDQIVTYLEAGAAAVGLTGALYSAELLAAGDHRAVRDFAALTHRDAATHAATRAAKPRGPAS